MRLRCKAVWGVISLACVFVPGCKDVNPLTYGSPSNVIFPNSNVSYGQHVQPTFDQACNYSGCHDDGQHQSDLRLTNYDNTVRMLPGIVYPGDPSHSLLVLRIQGSITPRMPPDGNGLNDNQINGIRSWIVEGAKNN